MTITGTNFTDTSTVEFGTVPSTKVTYDSSKKIVAVSPSEAPATVNVRVFNGKQESAIVAKDEFTFTPPACTDSWTGKDSSSWSTAGNWSTGKVPGKKDVACIPAGKPNLPVQLTSSASVTTITDDGGLAISATLTIKDGNSTSSGPLTLDGGTISGSGTLTVTGTLTTDDGTVDSTLDVASGASWSVSSGSDLVIGGKLTNAGTGTLESSAELAVANGATVTNSGTFTMDEGSDLDSNSSTGGTFDNTGTLDVAPGASETAYVGEYDLGLTVDNSGTIDLVSGTLDDADYAGYNNNFDLDSGSSITGSGTFEDSGSLVANAASSVSNLALVSGGTVSGSEVLTVTGDFFPSGGVVEGQLINAGTGTLESSAELAVANGATVTNSGTFTMDEGSDLDSNSDTGGTFDNTGTLDVAPGASETAYVGDTYYGLTVVNSGTIDLVSGTLDDEDYAGYNNNFDLDSGSSITGSGTFEDSGSLVANASVSFATLTLDGGTLEVASEVDVDPTSFGGSSGTVQLDSGGPTGFGEIVVTKSAKPTNMALDVNASFTPSCSESVTAVQANSVSGPFASVTGPVPSGGTWEPTSTSKSAGGTVDCS